MRALGNGAADVGVFTLDGVLRMLETGQDLRVLMVLDESRGADMVLARAGVESVAGLRGKRVGVDVRGAGIYILLNALESVGMAPQDVRLVPMVQPELEQALADEAVDAVVASEPWASHLRQAGMHAIFDSRSLKVPVMRMMVASGEACRLYRPQLQELMKAQADLTKKLRSGQAQDEMNLVLRREKISRETFQESLMKWQPLDGSRNAELLAGVRPKLVEIASAVALQMQQGGLLGNLPKNDVWIDAALMQEVWR
jgi:NitT/TauT family transport system substrate-binding protein